jgi:hypothetical protein
MYNRVHPYRLADIKGAFQHLNRDPALLVDHHLLSHTFLTFCRCLSETRRSTLFFERSIERMTHCFRCSVVTITLRYT